MPKMFIPVGKMNMDKGPIDGDHLWVAKDVVFSDTGYEAFPVATEASTLTVTSGGYPRGALAWRGSGSSRIYYASDLRLWEIAGTTATGLTRAVGGNYDNGTYGAKFAAYGDTCYMTNGVDYINSIIVPAATGGTTNFSNITYTSGGAVIAPKYICSHKNHLVVANIKMLEGYGDIGDASTTGIATPFTQPSAQRLEVVSTDVGDTTQTFTIYGCKGSDTVVVEIVALNGTTAVGTIAPHTWTKVLAVQKSAVTVGTTTLQVFGGGAAVTSLAPATLSGGIYNVSPSISAGDSYVDIVCDTAATTRQVGLVGTNSEGTVIYDSQALASTTTVQSNSKFRTVANILIGDVPLATTVTINTYQFATGETYEHLLWISGTDLPTGYGDPQVSPQIIGSDYRYLFDGLGKITGIIDGGDCFFVFKSGSIHRFDGPPFQPTVISYNIGMEFGNTPYRQEDRIYFWTNTGLMYIDIKSNQIVDVFAGVMKRSVTDAGNSTAGLSIGYFPKQNLTTPTISGASPANYRNNVSLSGDSRYGLVFMSYEAQFNAFSSSSNQLLCYNSITDSITLISGAGGAPFDARNAILVEYFDDTAGSYFLGSALRMIQSKTDTVHAIYKWSLKGVTAMTAGTEPYLRWPFKSVDPNASRVRITRVRPIFSNAAISDYNVEYDVLKINVISLSGTGKSWVFDGILSDGMSTYSKDGWYDIVQCPTSDSHSIGIHIDGTPGTANNAALFMANLIGIEIEFVAGPGSRSV